MMVSFFFLCSSLKPRQWKAISEAALPRCWPVGQTGAKVMQLHLESLFKGEQREQFVMRAPLKFKHKEKSLSHEQGLLFWKRRPENDDEFSVQKVYKVLPKKHL